MEKKYHILNGDALKDQFPEELQGEIIIARECLVDGEVKGKNLDEFFLTRARFITAFYGGYSVEQYFASTVSEFEKVKKIPRQSAIYLWFEDDLFCQVNFWFVTFLLFHFAKDCEVFLVRPAVHTPYGFGGLNKAELLQRFTEKVPVTNLRKMASLWEAYQSDNRKQLLRTATELQGTFPFVLHAVNAHLARFPDENSPGRPVQALTEIMNELKTEEFAPVFREFSKRQSIYGFGDLQVKRLFNKAKSNR